jgi:HSP20 family protein
VQSLQQEMNRLFGSFFDSPSSSANGSARWVPPMDLIETEQDYVLRADLPGVHEQDVQIEFEDNVLTISGERKPDSDKPPEGFYRIERASGLFARSLVLPEGIDSGQIQASFDRGVLEIRIPRPEQRKPRRVAISIGDKPQTHQTIQGTESRATEPVTA